MKNPYGMVQVLDASKAMLTPSIERTEKKPRSSRIIPDHLERISFQEPRIATRSGGRGRASACDQNRKMAPTPSPTILEWRWAAYSQRSRNDRLPTQPGGVDPVRQHQPVDPIMARWGTREGDRLGDSEGTPWVCPTDHLLVSFLWPLLSQDPSIARTCTNMNLLEGHQKTSTA